MHRLTNIVTQIFTLLSTITRAGEAQRQGIIDYLTNNTLYETTNLACLSVRFSPFFRMAVRCSTNISLSICDTKQTSLDSVIVFMAEETQSSDQGGSDSAGTMKQTAVDLPFLMSIELVHSSQG